MQLDLLFLPLLGGYIFYTKFAFTAYRAQRIERERLIFNSAACGLVALVLARLLVDISPFVQRNSATISRQALSAMPSLALVCAVSTFYQIEDRWRSQWKKAFGDSVAWLMVIRALLFGILAAFVWRRLEQSWAMWIVPTTLSIALVSTAGLLSSASRRVELKGALFHTALFGLVACAAIFLFADQIVSVEKWWAKFSPVAESGTPFVAFLLGATMWRLLNILVPYRSALAILHENGSTDALDAFLHNAAEEKALVQLSLSDGKFYIGNIRQLPANPAASNAYVRILPMISGYRDDKKKELHFTAFYQDVYGEMTDSPAFSEDWLNTFVKVVPIATIASANRFDPTMYIRFSKDRRNSLKARAKRPPTPAKDQLQQALNGSSEQLDGINADSLRALDD